MRLAKYQAASINTIPLSIPFVNKNISSAIDEVPLNEGVTIAAIKYAFARSRKRFDNNPAIVLSILIKLILADVVFAV